MHLQINSELYYSAHSDSVISMVSGGLSVASLAPEAVLRDDLVGSCWVGGVGVF